MNSFLRLGIQIEFDNLRAHCDFVKNSLEQEQKRFDDFIKKAIENLNEEEKEYILEWHQDEALQIIYRFPSLQWSAAFMLTYSTFESRINDVCKAIHISTRTNKNFEDTQGQGIERAKSYLSNTCGIDKPFRSEKWAIICGLSKLRNIITHADGTINPRNRKHNGALQFTKKCFPHIIELRTNFDESATLRLDMEFNVACIDIFRHFLLTLCDAHTG